MLKRTYTLVSQLLWSGTWVQLSWVPWSSQDCSQGVGQGWCHLQVPLKVDLPACSHRQLMAGFSSSWAVRRRAPAPCWLWPEVCRGSYPQGRSQLGSWLPQNKQEGKEEAGWKSLFLMIWSGKWHPINIVVFCSFEVWSSPHSRRENHTRA